MGDLREQYLGDVLLLKIEGSPAASVAGEHLEGGMMRSGAIGCVVLFGVVVLGACSAGSGPVGIPPFGGREPVGTGRDDPGTGGRGATGGTGEAQTPAQPQQPAKPAAPSGCAKCGKYVCTGVVKGMQVDATLNLAAGAMGACTDGTVTLNCGGVLKQAGGNDGTWKSAGGGLSLSSPPDALNCFPM